MIQTGTFVFELLQETSFFQEISALSIEYSDRCLENDDYINLMHNNLDDLTFVWLLRWILFKLKSDGLFHALCLVHEVSLVAIIQDQTLVF
jgi:hypothetical protein